MVWATSCCRTLVTARCKYQCCRWGKLVTTRVSVLAIRQINSIVKTFQTNKVFHWFLKPYFTQLYLVFSNTHLIEGVAVTLILWPLQINNFLPISFNIQRYKKLNATITDPLLSCFWGMMRFPVTTNRYGQIFILLSCFVLELPLKHLSMHRGASGSLVIPLIAFSPIKNQTSYKKESVYCNYFKENRGSCNLIE